MNKLVLLTLLAPLTANALTINSGATDVGGLDSLIDVSQLVNSGQSTETMYVAKVIGDSNFIWKTGELTAIVTDDDDSIFATDITTGDDYYVLKNNSYWALFDNIADLNWAVYETVAIVDVNTRDSDQEITSTLTGQSFSDLFNLGPQTTISHITIFDGNEDDDDDEPNPAPAPTPIALMALGLAGLGFTQLRKK